MYKIQYVQISPNASDRLHFSSSLGGVEFLSGVAVEITDDVYNALLAENSGFKLCLENNALVVSKSAESAKQQQAKSQEPPTEEKLKR